MRKLVSAIVAVAVLAVGATVFAQSAYRDVPDGHSRASDIAVATALGAFKGGTDGSFNPEGRITTRQMERVLSRLYPEGITRAEFASFVVAGNKVLDSPITATTTTTTTTTTTAPTTTTTAVTTTTVVQLELPRQSPEVDRGSYNRGSWYGSWPRSVNAALRWRATDCKWAYYSARSAACNVSRNDPHRDHLVALKEAYVSGGSTWSNDRKYQFATDVDNLWVLSASENTSKSDSDPAEWLPRDRQAQCRYVRDWVEIKIEYNLTADQAELRAIRNVLAAC